MKILPPPLYRRISRGALATTTAALVPSLAWAETPVPNVGSSLLQVTLGLGVVVALLIGALWLLKRLSAPRGATAGLLKVVAGTAVGQRERVVIVEVADTWLVLGVAPGQVRALHQMPRQVSPIADAAPPAREFANWLKQIMERKHAR